MYKYLIISIALMFISAGGYYINTAGGGIMGNIISGNVTSQEELSPLNQDDVPGVYICYTQATCKNKYTLILKSDRTFKFIRTVNDLDTSTSSESDPETTPEPYLESSSEIETGNWNIEIKNMMVLNILKQGNFEYEIPQKIVIQNVKQKTLSKISYTKSNYKDMTNPIFIKQ